MENLKLDIVKALESIEGTTILFYKQDENKGFQMLEETVIKLAKAIEGILLFNSKNNSQIIGDEMLNKTLTDLTNAIEVRDVILISDILEYEIKIMLQSIKEKV